jgi:alpha-beta hydrolase superfamily lysophospholipase
MARILLFHGAFAGASCWEPVLPDLRAAGHAVEALALPGSPRGRRRARRRALADKNTCARWLAASPRRRYVDVRVRETRSDDGRG